jgi:hypothetical protein
MTDEEKGKVYKILFGKPWEARPLGKSSHRWFDYMETVLEA